MFHPVFEEECRGRSSPPGSRDSRPRGSRASADLSRFDPRHRAPRRRLQPAQWQWRDDQLEDVAADRLQGGQVLDDHGVGAEQQVVRGIRIVIDRRGVDSHEVDLAPTSQAAVASLSTG